MRPVWRIPFATNSLLLWAVGGELLLLSIFLYVPFIADVLDQAPPSWAGFAVALLAMPVVLVADTAQKAWVRRQRDDRLAAR